MFLDVEAQMTYVERVCEFAQLPPEAAALVKGDPPEPWPPLGGISFQNAELRYRPGLPLALKDACFTVKPGQKVGICGEVTQSRLLGRLIAGRTLIDCCGSQDGRARVSRRLRPPCSGWWS